MRLNDTMSAGGEVEGDANSVDDCLMACSVNADCLAIDVDDTVQVEGLRYGVKHCIMN